MGMLLEDKTAIVYGGGGRVGGAVARAFAREGARVFVAGRREPLEAVVQEIAAAGGHGEVSEVDALDEAAVDDHAAEVARTVGGIDVSFNAIGHGDVHGSPLLEMPYQDFVRPVATAMRTMFLTTRAAARHMVPEGSGVVMTITATTARLAIPEVGGTGVTFDAMESLCRQWATELGRLGVRVVWLRTTGLPEALAEGMAPAYGRGRPMSRDEHVAWMEGATMLGRLTTLQELGDAAAFLASDRASATTGAAANLTCGAVPD
jgi:3-oxoacyl-[acyl-carrier protein] reductase